MLKRIYLTKGADRPNRKQSDQDEAEHQTVADEDTGRVRAEKTK